MISTELMEVLLRSVPQYFLFAILGLYIFGWVDKKPIFGLIAEVAAIMLGLLAIITLKSNIIPSPETEGIDAVQIKKLIQLLMLMFLNAGIAFIAFVFRINKKKASRYFSIGVVILSLYIFFQMTNSSKVQFKLTPQVEEIRTK